MDSREAQLDRLLSFHAIDPTNSKLLADIAALQYQLGKTQDARISALKALNIDADNAGAHSIAGLAAALTGDSEAAIEHLKRAVTGGANAPVLHFQLANLLCTNSLWTDAEAPAHYAAQHPTELPLAPALYLRVLHYLEKFDEAIAYSKSLLANPGNIAPRVQGVMSTIYLDREDFENTRAAAQAALVDDANDVDGNTVMGMLALSDMEPELALSSFNRVLVSSSKNSRARLGVGLSHLLAGDLQKAISAFENTLESMPAHLGTYQALAWCHVLHKDAQEAESVLRRALDIDHNFSETHGGLAVTALMRGNIDSAVQAAKRAKSLDKNNFAGNFAQSLIQQVSGNAEQARKIVEALITQPIFPDGKTIHSAIAMQLAKQKID